MIDTHLQSTDFNLLLTGLLAALVSAWFFYRQKYTPAIAVLFAGALLLRLMMAHIDPFFYPWDEQYHALVAKNMLQHPFTPTLIDHPVLPYDYTFWSENHIWVHKQPLFLWQMALSYKIFGVTAFAAKLPSALMSALIVIFIYRMGKITVSERIGYLAAFLFTFSYTQLNLVTGSLSTDHNDMAFMFYVTASIWALVEYLQKPNYKWVVLIGALAGMAVLNKWLTGLLVFSGWGVYLLAGKKRFSLAHYKHLLLATGVCLVVFIPWQLYILYHFPVESRHEFSYNTSHLFTPVEGHDGTVWFHFEQLAFIYGWLAPWILLPALLVFYFRAKPVFKWMLVFYVLLVYTFFSFAATKMQLFCNVVAPLVFIFLACFLNEVVQLLSVYREKIYRIVLPLALMVVGCFTIDFKALEKEHTTLSQYPHVRHIRLQNTLLVKEAIQKIPSAEYIVMNCGRYQSALVMFYSGCTAYSFMGTHEQYLDLKKRGFKMAVFVTDDLPEYYRNDEEVIKLDYRFL